MLGCHQAVRFLAMILVGGFTMSVPIPPGQRDKETMQAAKIAVAFLRASLTPAEGNPERDWVVLPERRVVSFPELSDFLAVQPKPVVCRVRILDRRIEVECGPPDSGTGWFMRMRSDSVEAKIQSMLQGIARPKVMIQAGTDTLLVSVEAYRRWIADYGFASGVHSLLEPSQEATARGAHLLVRFSPTGGAGATLRVEPDSTIRPPQ